MKFDRYIWTEKVEDGRNDAKTSPLEDAQRDGRYRCNAINLVLSDVALTIWFGKTPVCNGLAMFSLIASNGVCNKAEVRGKYQIRFFLKMIVFIDVNPML